MEHLKLILLVTSFIFPLVLGIILLLNSEKNLSRLVMAFVLFNISLVFLFNYLYFEKIYSLYVFIYCLHIGLAFWIFPMIYLYIRSVVVTEKTTRKELWHLFPGVFFSLISAIVFYGFLNGKERLLFLINHRENVIYTNLNSNAIFLCRLVEIAPVIIQVIYYSIVFVKLPNIHSEKLQNEFSDIEKFSIDRIKWFNVSFFVIAFIYIVLYIYSPVNKQNELVYISIFCLFSITVWVLGITSFKQQVASVNWDELDGKSLPDHENGELKDDILAKRLNDYIENKQIYLQTGINLTNLSRDLGTNRSYLSAFINQQFGMNFNSYINQYRVKYINDYLAKYPLTSKDELVQLGGFGSKSTMMRAMKKKIK